VTVRLAELLAVNLHLRITLERLGGSRRKLLPHLAALLLGFFDVPVLLLPSERYAVLFTQFLKVFLKLLRDLDILLERVARIGVPRKEEELVIELRKRRLAALNRLRKPLGPLAHFVERPVCTLSRRFDPNELPGR